MLTKWSVWLAIFINCVRLGPENCSTSSDGVGVALLEAWWDRKVYYLSWDLGFSIALSWNPFEGAESGLKMGLTTAVIT